MSTNKCIINGSLACLNLGDCSLCLLPTSLQAETGNEEKSSKQETESNNLKKFLKKIYHVFAA